MTVAACLCRWCVWARHWTNLALRERSKAFFFEKKKQKTFVYFGFGLSGQAQPRLAPALPLLQAAEESSSRRSRFWVAGIGAIV
jgi:hypothetical protein